MSASNPTVGELAAMARHLSPADRVRLIEQVAASLASGEQQAESKKPKKSLYGLWKGISISAEEIDEARREMWGNFPREDV